MTTRQANLHAAVLAAAEPGGDQSPDGADLYTVASRPVVVRDGAEPVEVWAEPLAVDRDLPTLPLALSGELCVPIDLEATYTAACSRRLE